jgi:hypothetical protein
MQEINLIANIGAWFGQIQLVVIFQNALAFVFNIFKLAAINGPPESREYYECHDDREWY